MLRRFYSTKATVTNSSASGVPNQSLKLTEGAVDDFARAKQPATIGRDLAHADWISLRRVFAAAA